MFFQVDSFLVLITLVQINEDHTKVDQDRDLQNKHKELIRFVVFNKPFIDPFFIYLFYIKNDYIFLFFLILQWENVEDYLIT